MPHRYTLRNSDPLYGYWFFEAYYNSIGKQLSIISPKFMPETEAQVIELLSFQANMYALTYLLFLINTNYF